MNKSDLKAFRRLNEGHGDWTLAGSKSGWHVPDYALPDPEELDEFDGPLDGAVDRGDPLTTGEQDSAWARYGMKAPGFAPPSWALDPPKKLAEARLGKSQAQAAAAGKAKAQRASTQARDTKAQWLEGSRAGKAVAHAIVQGWAKRPTEQKGWLALAGEYGDKPDHPGAQWWKGFRTALAGQRVESVMAETTRAQSVAKKRAFVKGVQAKHGSYTSQAIDPSEYPTIRGMEGPFSMGRGRGKLSHRVLYYDPKEGKYYDSKSDMYVDEGQQRESAGWRAKFTDELDGRAGESRLGAERLLKRYGFKPKKHGLRGAPTARSGSEWVKGSTIAVVQGPNGDGEWSVGFNQSEGESMPIFSEELQSHLRGIAEGKFKHRKSKKKLQKSAAKAQLKVDVAKAVSDKTDKAARYKAIFDAIDLYTDGDMNPGHTGSKGLPPDVAATFDFDNDGVIMGADANVEWFERDRIVKGVVHELSKLGITARAVDRAITHLLSAKVLKRYEVSGHGQGSAEPGWYIGWDWNKLGKRADVVAKFMAKLG